MALKKYKLILLLVLAVFVFSACSLPFKKKVEDKPLVEQFDPNLESIAKQKTGKMKKFANSEDYNLFLATLEKNVVVSSDEKKSPVVDIDYYHNNYSVDPLQADIMKYDSGFFYVLAKDEISIIKADGDSSTLISKIDLDQAASGMLVSSKSLVVYGSDISLGSMEEKDLNFVQVYDLSVPANPRLTKNYSFEGDIENIHLKNNNINLVSISNLNYRSGELNLPALYVDEKKLTNVCDGVEKCFSPNLFYFDINYQNPKLVNIYTLDLQNEFSEIKGNSYLANHNQGVFVSGSSIFISYFESRDNSANQFEAMEHVLFSKLSEEDKQRVLEIRELSDFVLSSFEKVTRIRAIYDAYLNSQAEADKTLLEVDIRAKASDIASKQDVSNKTLIHKIIIDENVIDYYALGSVEGRLFDNNYSLIEKDNHVYVASYGDSRLNNDGELRYYSSIYILNEKLKDVGKMENLNSGEDIFGVRFIGNRAYIISSEEGGSVFVLNLEDKSNPEFAGTIKVPGNSVYLRPINESATRFLSFSLGVEVESGFEEINGIKISIFDFSNLKEPRELDSYLLGDSMSNSIAFLDRQSLYYSSHSNTIVLPISFREEGSRVYFSGLFAFSIENDALNLLGNLDHSLGGFYNYPESLNGITYFDNSVKRSIVIDDYLYSFSNKFFASLVISNMEELSMDNLLELSYHSDDLLISSFESENPEREELDEKMEQENAYEEDEYISGDDLFDFDYGYEEPASEVVEEFIDDNYYIDDSFSDNVEGSFNGDRYNEHEELVFDDVVDHLEPGEEFVEDPYHYED